MPTYSGKFQYTSDPLREGACQVSFDPDTCTLTPASGTAIAFDLGDVDVAIRNEWDLQLQLFTGRTLTLRQFGPAFDRMGGELIAAWRDRSLRCMLLDDLEPVGAYDGSANGIPAQIRIFKSNIAVLPLTATPYQLRLAQVDDISSDPASYAITLRAGNQTLSITRLAKKTDEFREKLQAQYDALRQHSAEALHQTFPFLDPDRLQQLLALMPEGRSVSFGSLAKFHSDLVEAFIKRARRGRRASSI